MANDKRSTPSRQPLPLGKVVKPYGRIDAVLITGGERYYLLSKGRAVAMIPAFMIEPRK